MIYISPSGIFLYRIMSPFSRHARVNSRKGPQYERGAYWGKKCYSYNRYDTFYWAFFLRRVVPHSLVEEKRSMCLLVRVCVCSSEIWVIENVQCIAMITRQSRLNLSPDKFALVLPKDTLLHELRNILNMKEVG